MTRHQITDMCPVCEGRLKELFAPRSSANYCCTRRDCLYNFQDEACPRCHEPVCKVVDTAGGDALRLECEHGHSWMALGRSSHRSGHGPSSAAGKPG